MFAACAVQFLQAGLYSPAKENAVMRVKGWHFDPACFCARRAHKAGEREIIRAKLELALKTWNLAKQESEFGINKFWRVDDWKKSRER
jgi:phage gp16-like protein